MEYNEQRILIQKIQTLKCLFFLFSIFVFLKWDLEKRKV